MRSGIATINTIVTRHPPPVTILPIFLCRPLFVSGIPIVRETLDLAADIPTNLFHENPPRFISLLLGYSEGSDQEPLGVASPICSTLPPSSTMNISMSSIRRMRAGTRRSRRRGRPHPPADAGGAPRRGHRADPRHRGAVHLDRDEAAAPAPVTWAQEPRREIGGALELAERGRGRRHVVDGLCVLSLRWLTRTVRGRTRKAWPRSGATRFA